MYVLSIWVGGNEQCLPGGVFRRVHKIGKSDY
jgi:hypothetical protein